jgi:hypothetical protein
MPVTVFMHMPPLGIPSSITKSQSLSTPSQVSVVGAVALHADQPVVPLQVSVPKHVAPPPVTMHVRVMPSIAAEHVQLRVIGWQNIPMWAPFASGAQV